MIVFTYIYIPDLVKTDNNVSAMFYSCQNCCGPCNALSYIFLCKFKCICICIMYAYRYDEFFLLFYLLKLFYLLRIGLDRSLFSRYLDSWILLEELFCCYISVLILCVGRDLLRRLAPLIKI